MKKKGFTLIELLAVIVILAIIALISMPIILNIIGNVQESSLNVIKNNMEKAAELYVFANLDEYNLKEGEKEYIQLSQLEGTYLKKVNNPAGSEACEGYVKVENVSGKITYSAYLDCGNGQNLLVDSSYVNYGGNYLDDFKEIKSTSDGGYIVVGSSNSTTYSGNTNKGSEMNYDAIIVKYDSNGVEEWSRNFGGSNHDYFHAVVEDNGGYVAVGESISQDGDMSNLETKQHNSILVKYDYNGNLVEKKVLFSYTGIPHSYARSIIYDGNNYYIGGSARGVNTAAPEMYIGKYDSSFNQIWVKTYGGTNYASYEGKIIKNSEGNLVIFGNSGSTNNEMSGLKIGPLGNRDAVIIVVDENNGNIISKGIFGGTNGPDSFEDIVEISDGYIAVGYSGSNDYHMENLHKGGNDAIVVKYSKVAIDGILPIQWVKVVGGSNNDQFNKLIIRNNVLTLIGSSNSIDGDMQSITKASNEFYDGFVVKMDIDGNVISKITYGGNKSDFLNSGIYNLNKYVIVGRSFSTDGNIEPFNLGNSDAIVVTLDDDLNPVKEFKLQTLLLIKPKEIVKNYGVAIPLPENKDNLKLYTTNDATKDLGTWYTSYSYLDPNSNYKAVNCLQPFDDANIKRLYSGAVNYQNTVSINPENKNNWVRIMFNFGSSSAGQEINSLYLKFNEREAVSVNEAVSLGYIEPLVISGGLTTGVYFFENTFNVLSGGSSGLGTVPSLNILIKPRDLKLEMVSFNSAKEPLITQARFEV